MMVELNINERMFIKEVKEAVKESAELCARYLDQELDEWLIAEKIWKQKKDYLNGDDVKGVQNGLVKVENLRGEFQTHLAQIGQIAKRTHIELKSSFDTTMSELDLLRGSLNEFQKRIKELVSDKDQLKVQGLPINNFKNLWNDARDKSTLIGLFRNSYSNYANHIQRMADDLQYVVKQLTKEDEEREKVLKRLKDWI
jgi:uncharacterized coiled-coil DUF342 family protein